MFQAKAFAKLWWLSLPAFLVATAFATAAQTQTTPGKDRSRIHRARGVSNLPSNRGRGRLGHRRSKLPRRRARAVHRATLSPISRHRGHLPLARQYHVELRDLVVKHEPGGLAVELRLSGPVTPRLSTLHTPARVVVDLPKTMLAASVRSIEVSGDGVKTVRASRGGHVPSTTRVVVDLARPLNYEIVPGGNNNWILKLHPVSTDNAGFVEAADQHRKEGIHRATEVPGSPTPSAQPTVSTSNSGSIQISDQRKEATHTAAEGPVLPSASAQPANGQPAPTASANRAASKVTGVVKDQTGAVIPDAELTLVERATGESRHTVSDNSGNFVFKDMPPGHYLLRGKAESMQSAEREVIVDRNAVEVTLMMR